MMTSELPPRDRTERPIRGKGRRHRKHQKSQGLARRMFFMLFMFFMFFMLFLANQICKWRE
jgi:hypothetical protein